MAKWAAAVTDPIFFPREDMAREKENKRITRAGVDMSLHCSPIVTGHVLRSTAASPLGSVKRHFVLLAVLPYLAYLCREKATCHAKSHVAFRHTWVHGAKEKP